MNKFIDKNWKSNEWNEQIDWQLINNQINSLIKIENKSIKLTNGLNVKFQYKRIKLNWLKI